MTTPVRHQSAVQRALRVGLNAAAIVAAVLAQFGGDRPATAPTLAALAVWAVLTPAGRALPQPWRALGWTAVVVLAAIGVAGGSVAAPIALAAGLFAVASAVDVPPLWLAGAVALGAVAYVLGGGLSEPDPYGVLLTTAVAAVIGFLSRQSALERRTQLALAQRRADTAVLGERARIARDLHDVLAHTLGGLVLQLDALDAVATARDAGGDVLTRVRRARDLAADGLDEAKRAVDALRGFPGPLDVTLAALVDRQAAAGADVALVAHGDFADVPGSVADVLGSIAVEALTNAHKHAPGRPVRVDLRADREVVRLRVDNPRTADAAGLGHGLRGMRERAGLVGATVTAGPDGDRWVVACEVRRDA